MNKVLIIAMGILLAACASPREQKIGNLQSLVQLKDEHCQLLGARADVLIAEYQQIHTTLPEYEAGFNAKNASLPQPFLISTELNQNPALIFSQSKLNRISS